MLPGCIVMSVFHADDGWFALSPLGQLICDPVLELATSKHIQPLLPESGPQVCLLWVPANNGLMSAGTSDKIMLYWITAL